MVDLISFVSQNSEIILLIFSLVMAMIARFFQAKSKTLYEAVQAVTDLSQTTLDAVKDGVVTGAELNSIVAKIMDTKTKLDAVIKMFQAPAPLTEKLSTMVMGFRRTEIEGVSAQVQMMKAKSK